MYFSVYGQNGIRIFPNLENTHTILPKYGKIRIRESPYFGIFHAVMHIKKKKKKKKKKRQILTTTLILMNSSPPLLLTTR